MIRTLPRFLLVALPFVAQSVAAPTVMAQVAVDQGALDRLKPSAPEAASPSAPRTVQRQTHRGRGKPQAASAAPVAKPSTSAVRQSPVAIAPAPPPPVSLITPPPPPAHPAPEVTIPVSPDALGNASRITGGVRVTFGPGAADLNPTTEAALRSTARTIGADPASTFNVYAYAAGTAEDPSTPRRLSLSRALAARAVLMSEGIASTRIYVRALGATPSDGPNDRVDVTQAGIAPSPS